MKKSKFLALALTVSIMIMGAGYALWDDVLTVQETVTMGDVDVEWFWQGFRADPNGVFQTNETGNKVRTDDKKGYILTVDNLYPGAEVRWDAQMINKGSLPVRFKDLNITINRGTAFVPYLEVKYDTRHYDDGKWSGYNVSDWVPFSDFAATMNNDQVLKGYVVETDERIQFGDDENNINCIRIRVSEDLPESFMNEVFEFKLDFTFEQAFPYEAPAEV